MGTLSGAVTTDPGSTLASGHPQGASLYEPSYGAGWDGMRPGLVRDLGS